MRRLLVLLFATALSCGPSAKGPSVPKDFDADAKSGPDGKRSGARPLPLNRAITDEINFMGQDKTDWYVVQLAGRPSVMTAEVHWDSADSDLMIDVFDEFGAQIAASPVRNK